MAKVYHTIIIGAGPAGLFAALNLKNAPVLVIEKKGLPGRKLMIAGQGRCNITHSGDISAFLDHYGNQSAFIRNALYQFNNSGLISFFESHGLKTIEDKNGKIFPSTQRSQDVLNVLTEVCRKAGVSLHTSETVTEVTKTGNGFLVTAADTAYAATNLLIATGGMSYPSTGSTGDGYSFARALGHTIIPVKPSLSPVFIQNYRHQELAGVSLTGVRIMLYRDQKKIAEHTGDIGFTHKGLSGPGILDFSRSMQAGDELKINFTGIRTEDFSDLVVQETRTDGRSEVQTLVKRFNLPRSLVKSVLGEISIPADLRLGEISREQRIRLSRAFTSYAFLIDRVGGFNMAMATHGGVDTAEISRKTMESKIVPGLYFAGEVMDIDGDTGGYNLQAAFSTAFLAAFSINHK